MLRVGLLCSVVGLFAAGCGPGCDNSQCAADQVCTSQGCAPALSATYKLTMHLTVNQTELDGTDWDSASALSSGSPPDPGATLGTVEGTFLAGFSAEDDTYLVQSVSDNVRFDGADGGYDGGLMVLYVFDQDGAPGTGDAICTAAVGPDAVSVLHAGSWDGGLKGACRSVSIDFEAH
jgi:hypothetical protein